MPKKSKRSGNMKLAGFFVLAVLGLVIVSGFFKILFLIKDSRFDGLHKFNVEFVEKNKISIVSFSPQNRTISIIKVNNTLNPDPVSKNFAIIVDGRIFLKNDLNNKNLFSAIIKSALPLGNTVKDLTMIDLVRLSLFSRSVPQNSIYDRGFLQQYNEAQKATIISLSFTDPVIYQENQSIEIVNATDVFGLGGRLANLISNAGGNVILITSADKESNNSKITYSGEKTYTVKKLGEYLNFPVEKADKKGIADVIIIIGKDKAQNNRF